MKLIRQWRNTLAKSKWQLTFTIKGILRGDSKPLTKVGIFSRNANKRHNIYLEINSSYHNYFCMRKCVISFYESAKNRLDDEYVENMMRYSHGEITQEEYEALQEENVEKTIALDNRYGSGAIIADSPEEKINSLVARLSTIKAKEKQAATS